MKYLKLVFVLALVMLPHGVVYADTPTPTPPDTSYLGACPDYPPEGQLSIEYMTYCGHCLPQPTSAIPTLAIPTPEMLYLFGSCSEYDGALAAGCVEEQVGTLTECVCPGSFNWGGAGGGTPTVIPSTPIPQPTPTPQVDHLYMVQGENYTWHHDYVNQVGDTWMPDSSNYKSIGGTAVCGGDDITVGWYTALLIDTQNLAGDMAGKVQTYFGESTYWGSNTWTRGICWDKADDYYAGGVKYGWGRACSEANLQVDISYNNNNVNDGSVALRFRWPFQSSGNVGYSQFKLCYGNEEPGQEPEPTPTPVPTQVPGYCSTYDYMTTDTIVGYGGITTRQGDCIILIPDISIDLPAVGELIPAVQFGTKSMAICPVWHDLGQFSIANIDIPIDILALPALVFVLLMIFRL